ncbi:MAG TPA: signal peptidase II [Bacteroidales bacterium]|nr:signal peptidase II [Bacteroidales bacterium]
MKLTGICRKALILILILLNIGCDQVSKYIIRGNIEYYEQVELIKDYLILTKVENTGGFLGFGSAIHPVLKKIFFLAFPALVLIILMGFVLTKTRDNIFFITGVSFIIGGGIGNIFDRIVYGSVTDFLHIDIGIFKTGIFNLADVSIMLGTALILIYNLTKKRTLSASQV